MRRFRQSRSGRRSLGPRSRAPGRETAGGEGTREELGGFAIPLGAMRTGKDGRSLMMLMLLLLMGADRLSLPVRNPA